MGDDAGLGDPPGLAAAEPALTDDHPSTTEAVLSAPCPEPAATPAEAPGPRRRWLLAAGVAAVLAAGSVVAAGVAGSDPAGGRLVAVTSSGAMVTTSADGTDRAGLEVPAGPGLVVSPDGRYLATGTGDELSLVANRLVPTGRRAELAGPPGSWRAIDFADHDLALVAVENGDDPVFGGLIVEAQTFSGRTVAFGEALDVAGDPRALGVFAVGVGPVTTGSLRGGALGATTGGTGRGGATAGAGTPGVDPGTEVELRDAGRPTVVLAGSAELARSVGLPAGEPVVLSVEPDPGGGKVAVAVAPLSGRTGGLVVLSRAGRVLGALRVPTGALEQPAWSPDGTTLVLSESRSARPAVLVWRIGQRPQVRVARASTTGRPGDFGNCLWTARSEFLCADTSVQAAAAPWLVGSLHGPSVRLVTGPTLPIGWVRTGKGWDSAAQASASRDRTSPASSTEAAAAAGPSSGGNGPMVRMITSV